MQRMEIVPDSKTCSELAAALLLQGATVRTRTLPCWCVCVCNERKPKLFLGGGGHKPGDRNPLLLCGGVLCCFAFAGSHLGVCVLWWCAWLFKEMTFGQGFSSTPLRGLNKRGIQDEKVPSLATETTASQHGCKKSSNSCKFCSYEEAPSYLQHNKFIRTGYRANFSLSLCLRSVFHVHNGK